MTTVFHFFRSGRRREAILATVAAVPALLVGVLVHRQGFNLLDDGLWALGTGLVADGGVLYRDLFSIYGPARYFLLWPFFLVFGHSALALAVAKAVFDAVAAGAAFVLARRLHAGTMAWLAPFAVLALGPILPRYVYLLLFSLLAIRMAERDRRRDRLMIGCAWGGAALFGLDAFLYASLVSVAGGFLAAGPGPTLKRLPLQLAAAGAVFAVLLAWAAAAGCLSAVCWDTLVYPLTRFRGAMGVSWLDVIRSGDLGLPFAGLYTGEKLPPIFSQHSGWLALALRALFVGLWLVPMMALWRLYRLRAELVRRPAWGFAIALALTGWVTILGRGDPEHLRQAWLGSVCLAAALVGGAFRPAARALPVLMVVLICFGPLVMEKAWLVANSERDGLVEWTRPTARILVADSRRAGIEALLERLPPEVRSGDSPVLIWPNLPGIHFLAELTTATAQATLLPGEVRDADALAEHLKQWPPAAFISGAPARVVSGLTNTRDEAPAAWDFLRRDYWLAVTVNAGEDDFRLGLPVAGSDRPMSERSLQDMIPDIEQGFGGGLGPPMRPGLGVGQSFVTSGLGLSGVAVRWVVEPFRPGLEFPVRVSIWKRSAVGGRFDTLIGRGDDEVRLEKSGRRSYYDLRPAHVGPGLDVAVTFELLQPPVGRVSLSLAAGGEAGVGVDYYSGGTALVGGRSVDEDLYFYTW